uniref:Thyroglobulin type-1 domain-containing protein n=1 Tax=Pseudonaja textilis TaxID=8673 RepID=A0A670Y8G8_PSETE
KFHCRRRADRAGAELNVDCTEEDNDVFVPDCTEDGNYKEIQCKRGECWCVDLRGKEIPGSRVRGTNPRCPTMGGKGPDSLH